MTAITVVTPWLQAHDLAPAYQRALSVLGEDDDLIIFDNGDAPDIDRATYLGRIDITSMGELEQQHTTGRNRGFSRACNLGLYAAATDAVLWLNNDIRMTSATWLEQIRRALKPGVLVGAQLRHDDHTIVDGKRVPYLDGWCLAGMTADLLDLDGFDEDYEEPSYYGDNDLCARAVAAGLRLVQVPVGLTHIGNHTSKRVPGRDDLAARNRLLYERTVRSLQSAAA